MVTLFGIFSDHFYSEWKCNVKPKLSKYEESKRLNCLKLSNKECFEYNEDEFASRHVVKWIDCDVKSKNVA